MKRWRYLIDDWNKMKLEENVRTDILLCLQVIFSCI